MDLGLNRLKNLNYHLLELIETRLWLKVMVSMFLGLLVGILIIPSLGFVPENIGTVLSSWVSLPGLLFLKLVQMIMIPLIFTSIIQGIVSNNLENLKSLGVKMMVYFIATTAIAIIIGLTISELINPGKYFELSADLINQSNSTVPVASAVLPKFHELPNTITGILPSNPLDSMVKGEMLGIVLFTIIIGIALTSLEQKNAQPVLKLLSAIQEICMTIVKWAMKLVPYAVFGLMVRMCFTVGLNSILGIGMYILSVIIGLILLLLMYMIIVKFLSTHKPIQFLKDIRDAQLLAFSTTSSAAVMPLSMKTAEEKLKVAPSVSNFVIPIGATINMDGTALYQCISAIFIAQVYQIELSTVSIILMLITIIAASIGTPAIPGGGVIVMASILATIGIPTEGLVLIIGVERILGMFRASINVTGDLTACVVFNDSFKPKEIPIKAAE